jgi:hypothetical protein
MTQELCDATSVEDHDGEVARGASGMVTDVAN